MKISSIIYDTFKKENKQWTPTNHNPSSASFKYSDGTVIGPDILSQYLKWTGVKPTNPPGPQALLKMDLGNTAHLTIANILAKAGIKAKSEVRGKFTHPELKHQISYRVDGLHEIDGVLEVLEVKSSTDQQMFGKGWGIKDKGPKEDHLLQTICYLNMEPGVKKARLLYLSRDSGDMLEYEITGSEDKYLVGITPIKELSWTGIVTRWKELEGYLERKEIPNPDYSVWLNDDGEIMDVKQIKGKKYKSDWRALYDPYKDLIWKDEKNRKFTYNEKFK